jgi:hypothetical protein
MKVAQAIRQGARIQLVDSDQIPIGHLLTSVTVTERGRLE